MYVVRPYKHARRAVLVWWGWGVTGPSRSLARQARSLADSLGVNAHAGGGGRRRHIDTTMDGLGVSSFVFSASGRPLDDERLMSLIQRWQATATGTALVLPVTSSPASAAAAAGELGSSPWEAVLRSKGTLWLRSKYCYRDSTMATVFLNCLRSTCGFLRTGILSHAAEQVQ